MDQKHRRIQGKKKTDEQTNQLYGLKSEESLESVTFATTENTYFNKHVEEEE
ncbi:hypothetical protein [Halalkalibacter urbisdiaboli]|uniref:hypothetical protein n=1 Tax=Halalkalibacter urbisdiaboli TaxID=1960589 RepID=UPI0013FE3AE8|nr:hypothetical protein [Halalkalibacter urbisdiaboli]